MAANTAFLQRLLTAQRYQQMGVEGMIGRIGMLEIILILSVALIIFGPAKLPELGRSIGNGLREFKKATNDLKDSISLEDVDKDNK